MARELDIQDMPGHKLTFTRNWFRNRNLETFRTFVHPMFSGKPTVYLEIGVFEGQSMVWMLQHVLTHKRSRAVGIDPWLMTTKLDSATMSAVKDRASNNTKPWRTTTPPKLILQQGNSAEVLRLMCSKGFAEITKDSVDVCMIDGDHNRDAALDDARHALQLIKVGGMLLFDDVENNVEKKDHVKHALEAFKEEAESKIEFVWKHKFVECYRRVK